MLLKLITLNLRYDQPDPGDRAWTLRREAIAAWINQEQPDFLGTQEGLAHQILDLHRRLPNYASVGGDRLHNGKGEYGAIFYHRFRWQWAEEGAFWLSETPTVPGSMTESWGNPIPRFVTWAKFLPLNSHHPSLLVANTHFDYHSSWARNLSAPLLLQQLQRQGGQDSYGFLMGDFNAGGDSDPRQILAQGLSGDRPWLDALAGLPLEAQTTYHDFTGQAWDAVDTIYYDARCSLQSARVERSSWQGILLSDHFPVLIEVLLPS